MTADGISRDFATRVLRNRRGLRRKRRTRGELWHAEPVSGKPRLIFAPNPGVENSGSFINAWAGRCHGGDASPKRRTEQMANLNAVRVVLKPGLSGLRH